MERKKRNEFVHFIIWTVAPLIMGPGLLLLYLATRYAPNDLASKNIGYFFTQWPLFFLVAFVVYVFFSRQHWMIAKLRIIPYAVGIGLLFLGIPGLLTGQYSVGGYKEYLWSGDIPGSISVAAEAYQPEITILVVCVFALSLVLYEARK